MGGIATRPMVAALATLEPVMAAKIAQHVMVAMSKLAGKKDNQLLAISNNPSVNRVVAKERCPHNKERDRLQGKRI
jgi:hypothetical protein